MRLNLAHPFHVGQKLRHPSRVCRGIVPLYREIERFQDWLTLGSLIKRVCRIMGPGADFLLRVSLPVEPAIIEAVLAPAIGVPPVIASQVILGPTFATDVTVASPVIAGQIIFGPAS